MDNDFNFLTETPVRYLAFSNDVGEVLRNVIGNKLAGLSWVVTIGYSLSDVFYSSYRMNKRTLDNKKVVTEAIDVFLWQFFASILITPFVLKGGCICLEKFLHKAKFASHLHPYVRKFAPHTITLVGGIPSIVPYGDQFVDDVMDKYYRQNPKNNDHLSHNFFWSGIIKRYPNLRPYRFI